MGNAVAFHASLDRLRSRITAEEEARILAFAEERPEEVGAQSPERLLLSIRIRDALDGLVHMPLGTRRIPAAHGAIDLPPVVLLGHHFRMQPRPVDFTLPPSLLPDLDVPGNGAGVRTWFEQQVQPIFAAFDEANAKAEQTLNWLQALDADAAQNVLRPHLDAELSLARLQQLGNAPMKRVLRRLLAEAIDGCRRGPVRYTLRGDVLRFERDDTVHLLGSPFQATLTARTEILDLKDALQAEALIERGQTELDAEAASLRAFIDEVEATLSELDLLPGSDPEILRSQVRTAAPKWLNLTHPRRRFAAWVHQVREDAATWAASTRRLRDDGLLDYPSLFPLARRQHRQWTFFMGPTNSGKTWHAFERLGAAGSGAYLAPLRLLALEGQEELLKRGVSTSFVTGEERDERPGARHTASTIEMLDLHRTVECIVIDEIQMLADPDRGWAWTQALVGAPAHQIILTGSAEALPLVEAFAQELDEPLEVVRLERVNPLEMLGEPTSLDDLEPGTAIITFSRRAVHQYAAEMRTRGRDVAMIYGALTPQVRRAEADRFRSGQADVLVSTDAISQGLNLPIRTLLFTTTEKYNGRAVAPLTRSYLMQIAGRAGRFGKTDRGFVGALDADTLAAVSHEFHQPIPELTPADGTLAAPSIQHLRLVADALGTESLAEALTGYLKAAQFRPALVTPHVPQGLLDLAELVDRHLRVPLDDRLVWATTPIDAKNPDLRDIFAAWFRSFSKQLRVAMPHIRATGHSENEELQAIEFASAALMAYAWLAFRYPFTFPDLDSVQAERARLDARASDLLRVLASRKIQRRTSRGAKA